MVETISIYEIAPLDAAKNKRLEDKISKLLKMGCAVQSFETAEGKRVVGTRVISEEAVTEKPPMSLSEAVRHLEMTLRKCHAAPWKLQSDTQKQSKESARTLRDECEKLEHALAEVRGRLFVEDKGTDRATRGILINLEESHAIYARGRAVRRGAIGPP